MQISQVMMLFSQPNFYQIWWKTISRPILSEMFDSLQWDSTKCAPQYCKAHWVESYCKKIKHFWFKLAEISLIIFDQNLVDRPQTAFPVHFDITYMSCNDHDTSCAVTKWIQDKWQKTVCHIGNFLIWWRKQFKILIFKNMRGESFRNMMNY